MVEAFQAAHGIEELVIVADAGMLSAANLKSLDEAHLRFIVGARTTRAPGDLEAERKSTRLNYSHVLTSRMPSSA